jgi:NAD(P)-dependent dehydrogenase (short-subunit alcohol dehydrogenase family)
MRANVPGKASLQALRQHYASKRLGTVSEQVQAILFLTSAESSFVTGVALLVDGGPTFH